MLKLAFQAVESEIEEEMVDIVVTPDTHEMEETTLKIIFALLNNNFFHLELFSYSLKGNSFSLRDSPSQAW